MPCVSPRRAGRCNKQTEYDERIEKEDCVMPIRAEVAPKRPRPDEIKESHYAESNAAPNCLATEILDHVVPADKTIIRFDTPVGTRCRHAPFCLIGACLRRAHGSFYRPGTLESRELTHKAAQCDFMGRDWIVTGKVKHQTFGDDRLSLRSGLQPN